MENLLPFDGLVYYYPEFFTREESDQFFEQLKEEVDWKQEPIKLFGKELMQPRLTAWYGEGDKPYSYSGIRMQPLPWTGTMQQIKERIEKVSGVHFTSALLNYYRNQQDSMGWHRDNEKELGAEPVIGSVSFGETREFQFRHYYRKDIRRSLLLTHGSFLLMAGSTQEHWEHAVPKRSRNLGGRINLTFRVIYS